MGAAPATGGSKRVGYFDESDGIYLERTSTATNIVLRSSTSKGTETVPQSAWNIDQMNGAGISGITLDLTKMQILFITMQALYSGRVIVGFDINGQINPVHQFLCANEETVPYIANASLPVRYEVNGPTSAGVGTVLNAKCGSVISEGGPELLDMVGRVFAASNGTTSITSSTRRAALSIRPKATLNGLLNRGIAVMVSVDASAVTRDIFVEVIQGGTLGGTPVWNDVNTSYSMMTYDVAGTTVTGGTVIETFYVSVGGGSVTGATTTDIRGKVIMNYSHLLSAADTMSVVINPIGGSSTFRSSINWKEIR